MKQPQLILASQSKYRKALLEQLGVPFTVQPAHVDESELKNETPLAYVKRIAMAKAAAISQQNPGSVVLAADTPVIVGRRILQTPATPEEAAEMIKLYSGRRVHIPTTLVVADASGKLHVKVTKNWIKFKRITVSDINDYLTHANWRVAGALKIEQIEPWIQSTQGTFSGIIGLPLYETTVLLTRAGIPTQPFSKAA
jgi:septum formation protein